MRRRPGTGCNLLGFAFVLLSRRRLRLTCGMDCSICGDNISLIRGFEFWNTSKASCIATSAVPAITRRSASRDGAPRSLSGSTGGPATPGAQNLSTSARSVYDRTPPQRRDRPRDLTGRQSAGTIPVAPGWHLRDLQATRVTRWNHLRQVAPANFHRVAEPFSTYLAGLHDRRWRRSSETPTPVTKASSNSDRLSSLADGMTPYLHVKVVLHSSALAGDRLHQLAQARAGLSTQLHLSRSARYRSLPTLPPQAAASRARRLPARTITPGGLTHCGPARMKGSLHFP